MRFKLWLEAQVIITLGTVAEVGTNIADADFWLQRKGSEANIGKVHRVPEGVNFVKENIGIKVREEWKRHLDPKYLSYMMEHKHMQGHWRQYAQGMLRLVSLSVSSVKELPLFSAEVPDDDHADPAAPVH